MNVHLTRLQVLLFEIPAAQCIRQRVKVFTVICPAAATQLLQFNLVIHLENWSRLALRGALPFFFSILCLTTHLIHQGHEKRKEIRDVSTFTAQHVRAALSVLHMAQKIVSRQKHNMLSLLHVACLKLLVFFF